MKRALRIGGLISGVMVLVTVIVILLNSQSIKLTKEDRVYLHRFLHEWNISIMPTKVHNNLQSELAFISRIQDSVLSDITGEQIPHAYFANVRYYNRLRFHFFLSRSS